MLGTLLGAEGVRVSSSGYGSHSLVTCHFFGGQVKGVGNRECVLGLDGCVWGQLWG